MQNAALDCPQLPTTISARTQALCPPGWRCLTCPAAMVRKGSPVRVRQRALKTALQRGFRLFGAAPLTPSEHFRARRGQAWPLAGAASSFAGPRSACRSRRRYRRGTRRTRSVAASVPRLSAKRSTPIMLPELASRRSGSRRDSGRADCFRCRDPRDPPRAPPRVLGGHPRAQATGLSARRDARAVAQCSQSASSSSASGLT